MKKATIIRCLTLVLALLMVSSVFFACNNGNEQNGNENVTTTGNGGQIQNPDDSGNPGGPITPDQPSGPVKPNIPDNLDFGGRTFTVHTRGNVEQYEWFAEGYNGEELNDAIYDRNEAVNDLLNIEVTVLAEGNWSNYSGTTMPKMKANISANSGVYDLIAGYSTPASNFATTGLIVDLNDVEYIDFDMPWWSADFYDKMTIADKTFFGIGSLSLSMIYSMECIYFNTDLIKTITHEDGSAIDIYYEAQMGQWTWKRLIEYADAFHHDNGDKKWDLNDFYGFAAADFKSNFVQGFFCSSGLSFYEKDPATGDHTFVLKRNDADAVIKYLRDFMWNTESVHNPDKGGAYDSKYFVNGTSLFYFHWLYGAQTNLSKVMSNYGILPMPKFDEKADYHTPVQSGMHMYAIPKDANNIEQVGIITEALAAESYNELVPAYLNICLKSRYSPEEDCAKVIDILYNTVTFDVAYTFNSYLIIVKGMQDLVSSGENSMSFTRMYDANKERYQGKMDELVTAIESGGIGV